MTIEGSWTDDDSFDTERKKLEDLMHEESESEEEPDGLNLEDDDGAYSSH